MEAFATEALKRVYEQLQCPLWQITAGMASAVARKIDDVLHSAIHLLGHTVSHNQKRLNTTETTWSLSFVCRSAEQFLSPKYRALTPPLCLHFQCYFGLQSRSFLQSLGGNRQRGIMNGSVVFHNVSKTIQITPTSH